MIFDDVPFPDWNNHLSPDCKRVPCLGWAIVGRNRVALHSCVIHEGMVLSLPFGKELLDGS